MEVKTGYKQAEVGVIPDKWEECCLQDLVDRSNPIAYGVLKPGGYVRNGTPLLQIRDVIHGEIDIEQLHRISANLDRQYSRTKLFGNEIVVSLVGTIGRVAHIPLALAGGNLHRNLARIALSEGCDARFVYYFLNSDFAQAAIKLTTFGSSQSLLNLADLRNLAVVVPPPPEQRAIAEALSDVDGLLGAMDRLIAKKRDLKQAAMQQLLTGQTRLPGFTGDWEKSTLGELVSFLSGGTPSRSNDNYWTGDIPWISASSLRCFEIWRSDSNVTKEAVAAGSRMAPVGASLLLVRGSALHNEILCGLVTRPVCFNQDVKALVPNSRVVPRFLTLFIKGTSDQFLKLVSSAGNTAGVLDTKLLRAFAIDLPKRDEQTAIAEVLSDMDAELAALEQRREKTRALKQGMMQELLTGRTRLV